VAKNGRIAESRVLEKVIILGYRFTSVLRHPLRGDRRAANRSNLIRQ
jgi:hypothetical protein